MLVPAAFPPLSPASSRAAALAELRLLLSRQSGWSQSLQQTLSFGLAALDCHLPNGGLANSALHEVIPARSYDSLCQSIVADLGNEVLSKEYTERND